MLQDWTKDIIACFAATGLVLAAGSSAYAAGDVKAGRTKAVMCQTCHGLDGLSKIPNAPNIAGQPEPYIIAQLHAYKSGARKNEMMSIIVPTLSDADIENLAAYYSAIEVKVGKMPGG